MKISELLENAIFNDQDFIEQYGDKKKINYDLIEDVVHYMNNNDSVYRKYLYPSIIKCVDKINSKQTVTSDIFKQAVINGYQTYIDEYPIRELPEKLSRSVCKKICDSIFEEVKNNISDGKYDN